MPSKKNTAFNFILADAAEQDLFEIIEWYRKIDSKLSERFIIELYDTFDLIAVNPTIFRIRYKKLRIVNLTIFPYQIVYQLKDTSIEVLAVIHSKRSPKQWKRRK